MAKAKKGAKTSNISIISKRALEIRKDGESWHKALSRASQEIKKEKV